IVFSLNTKPLAPGETKRYVQHRVRVSRRQGVEYPLFTEGALNVIVRRSGGIPRVINILADKALLVAFSCGSPTVLAVHVAEAVKDSPTLVVGHRFSLPHPSKRAWLIAAGIAVLLAVAAGGDALYALGRAHHAALPEPAPTAVAAASNPPPAGKSASLIAPAAPAPAPVVKASAEADPVQAKPVSKPAPAPKPHPAPLPVKSASVKTPVAPVKPPVAVATPTPAPVIPTAPVAAAPVAPAASVAPAQPPAPTPAPQPVVERAAPSDPLAAVGAGVYPGLKR
ncbi:MAG TPA: hypothetical protein VK558_13055, partial [Patescibacteria group bacterium]|nr:hypothetical protein [Patescibacteria group bacterium]